MFVRNCWYVAGWDYEFTRGELHARTIINEPLVLYRKREGTLVALENRCVHRLAALSLGCLEGDDLRCMYHGFKYAPDGQCVEVPGQKFVPPKARVRSLPVIEQHSWAWVWMGDPALADPSLIPPAVGLGDPQWVLKSGFLDYEANYQLINDNLTDLSHLSYTHRNSFLAGPNWINTQPTVTPLARGVRVERWIEDDPKPSYLPSYAGGTVDQWTGYDFLLPGIFLLRTAIYPSGTAATAGDSLPTDPLWETFTSQAVTPMTAATSRYFFSWGPAAVHGSEKDAEVMFQVALMAFHEDKTVIEAQQKIMNADPSRRILATRADHASITFERLTHKLINAEDSNKGVKNLETV
jgi:phenylpropionate dioxygenase-like ring-hydroxylating dioxygenase large terminal subunit